VVVGQVLGDDLGDWLGHSPQKGLNILKVAADFATFRRPLASELGLPSLKHS
jgi:hypothetical protein